MYDNFTEAPFDFLLERAQELVHHFACVNRPLEAAGINVLPATSTACVTAKPDDTVAFNFSSRAVQAMMLEAVPEAESVVDALDRHMAVSRHSAKAGGETCDRMDIEVSLFLDSLRGTGPLDADEIRDFSVESVRYPHL